MPERPRRTGLRARAIKVGGAALPGLVAVALACPANALPAGAGRSESRVAPRIATGLALDAPAQVSRAAVHAAAITTFTVYGIGDGADSAANGICRNAATGTCSRRAAIQEANRVAGPVVIAFAIPGTGLHTIAPASQLP